MNKDNIVTDKYGKSREQEPIHRCEAFMVFLPRSYQYQEKSNGIGSNPQSLKPTSVQIIIFLFFPLIQGEKKSTKKIGNCNQPHRNEYS